MFPSTLRSGAAYFLLFLGGCLLTGCTLKTTAVSGLQPGVSISGRVHGGQQPVVGASVYLLAASEQGYNGRSDSLLLDTPGTVFSPLGWHVTTGVDGSFTFDHIVAGEAVADYVCPAADTQVYVYVSGGDSGSGSDNPRIGLMTALGSCGGLADTTFVEVNEVTTVAAAYALSGFATDATDIASANSALSITGLKNAFLNAGQLADSSTGAALAVTPNGNGTVDQQQVYTLANILAACVNTDGAETAPPNETACYTLMNDAPTGGTSPVVPSDTATAAINIAHNAGANVATLATLSTTHSPFPSAGVPNDFTVGINYDTSFMNPGHATTTLFAIAIDAAGSAWFDYPDGSIGIGEFSSTGATTGKAFTDGALLSPGPLAIDQKGAIWVTDESSGGLFQFSSDGDGGEPGGGTTSGAYSVAIDAVGNVWEDSDEEFGTVVTEVISPVFTISSSTVVGFTSLSELAFDSSGNLWAVTPSGIIDFIGTEFSNHQSYFISGAGSIAIDSKGNAWSTGRVGYNPSQLFEVVGENVSTYSGGGLEATAKGVAIDGAGDVWVASYGPGSCISEFNSAGDPLSPATGFIGGRVYEPVGIAVDGSGDVWTANSYRSGGSTTVTELIGAAVPVVTPIAAGLVAPYRPGTRP